uniref:RING-type E3 ubiquitin transferase n=1 Tax=Kalanchoe fedtschenkoi TaxID=63787 RepID=A0A7N1A4P1_KALFE
MDESSARRGVDRLAVPTRGPRLVSRDMSKSKDQNIQLCNRIGCSGRLNPATSTHNVSLDKTGVLKSSSRCSAHGKEATGNSSKVVSIVTHAVKPLRPLRNKSPASSETDSSASSGNTSSDVREAEAANSNPPSEGSSRPVQLDHKESRSCESTSMEVGSPSAASSNARPIKRTFPKKPAPVVDSNISGPSSGSGASKSMAHLSKQNASATRPGSRFLRGSSAPDVVSSGSASNNRKQVLKKRSSEGESSASSRAKQPAVAESARTPNTPSGISISDTRQARSSQANLGDNVSASVRALRPSDTSTARRPPQVSRRELPTDRRMARLPSSLSSTGYPHQAHNFTRPSTTESSRSRILSSASEAARTRSLVDREGFRHYNMSGIAEVLLALDRIENDEEMSFEELLVLESNLFIGGLSFHDQHRDMRLDIDDMSYEELLALEERMGSVSTALSEEALAKCINKTIYKPKSSESSFSEMDGRQDDTKCSICQEEYATGDEMGRLHCKHSYHSDCIDQWLRQKNWCPICKSSAATSSSSS